MINQVKLEDRLHGVKRKTTDSHQAWHSVFDIWVLSWDEFLFFQSNNAKANFVGLCRNDLQKKEPFSLVINYWTKSISLVA